ncbi:MAG: hypothetical protein ACQKBU_05055, partial [Verrucomicrobiales bacterium]
MSSQSHASAISAAQFAGKQRDLVALFRQQMYFWGRDVSHRLGNVFTAFGMWKTPSPELPGSSRYSMPWQQGQIELHGACVGYYAGGEGFVFIRPFDRCYHWVGEAPAIPGNWDKERLERLSASQLHDSARPFLDWRIHYEERIEDQLGPDDRAVCFRSFRRLPRSRSVLPPAAAMEWVRRYRSDSSTTPRIR